MEVLVVDPKAAAIADARAARVRGINDEGSARAALEGADHDHRPPIIFGTIRIGTDSTSSAAAALNDS